MAIALAAGILGGQNFDIRRDMAKSIGRKFQINPVNRVSRIIFSTTVLQDARRVKIGAKLGRATHSSRPRILHLIDSHRSSTVPPILHEG